VLADLLVVTPGICGLSQSAASTSVVNARETLTIVIYLLAIGSLCKRMASTSSVQMAGRCCRTPTRRHRAVEHSRGEPLLRQFEQQQSVVQPASMSALQVAWFIDLACA
jgi:hypothetical protein